MKAKQMPPDHSSSITSAKPEIMIENVRDWLEQAWPGAAKYPSDAECYSIAVAINTVRIRGFSPPRRPHVLGISATHLIKFIKLLPEIRAAIDGRNQGQTEETLPEISGLPYPPLLRAQKKLDAAEQAIIALLDVTAPIPWLDPEVYIAGSVLEAWDHTGVKIARGKKEGGPLVTFVTLAMQYLGADKEAGGIADVLRGRRHRPR
jgi:hypothetical protein